MARIQSSSGLYLAARGLSWGSPVTIEGCGGTGTSWRIIGLDIDSKSELIETYNASSFEV